MKTYNVAALSRSAELLRKTWGEQLIANVTMASLAEQ